MVKDTRMVVDPSFKRMIGIKSLSCGFPSVKAYTKYLATSVVQENKKLKDLMKQESLYETKR